ncbi:MAG: 3-deoxy-D-manno-octulosonic acid transferase [Deltaproteobacteria bacterium]|nr:3-deoxy-D-manno-octulosonic acid transferase [Deltaproteobacteria bacterium]
MRALYSIVYALGFFLSSPYWIFRGLKNPPYRLNLKKRLLGTREPLPPKTKRPRVLVWALSLGEVRSARLLARELDARGAEVVVCASTLSGIREARAAFPDFPVRESPLDFAYSVKKFLDAVKPDATLLVETDIWPGFLLESRKRNIPVTLVSARLSPKSFRRYRLGRFYFRRIWPLFRRVAAQTEEDRAKFIALGANPLTTKVTGNLKFDETPAQADPEAKSRALGLTGWPEGRYLVAGSTHPGEETIILEAFREILPSYPELKLVLAPRDPGRFAEVALLIQAYFPAERIARRSAPALSDAASQAFLLDSLGELSAIYALADLAIVGKSFPGRHKGGGHNPLEPAALGVFVVAGRAVFNFQWIYGALSAAGGAELAEPQDLALILLGLLRSPERLREMGEKGRRFVSAHQGAVRATLDFAGEDWS